MVLNGWSFQLHIAELKEKSPTGATQMLFSSLLWIWFGNSSAPGRWPYSKDPSKDYDLSNCSWILMSVGWFSTTIREGKLALTLVQATRATWSTSWDNTASSCNLIRFAPLYISHLYTMANTSLILELQKSINLPQQA